MCTIRKNSYSSDTISLVLLTNVIILCIIMI
nr:MAG TPA: hypothetical protein [Caudoviricetes sp.]